MSIYTFEIIAFLDMLLVDASNQLCFFLKMVGALPFN
jgi:hypothetical protein